MINLFLVSKKKLKCLILFFPVTLSKKNTKEHLNHYHQSIFQMIILQTFNLNMKFISLLVIKIYQPFCDKLEVRAIFLDISKAFDKVWHKHLKCKLKQNSISGNILNTIIDFPSFENKVLF